MNGQSKSDRSSSEWLVHPLLQAARGYLTDEDYTAVEATLQEAVERAKDLEAENEALRGALTKIQTEEGKVCAGFTVCTHPACQSSFGAWAIADAALAAASTTKEETP